MVKKIYLNQLSDKSNLFKSDAKCAEVAELVDALGSGSSVGFHVRVRVSPSAPLLLDQTFISCRVIRQPDS